MLASLWTFAFVGVLLWVCARRFGFGALLLVLPLAALVGSRVVWLVVMTFGSVGHHLPGFLRTYGDRALFRQHRARFLLAPPTPFHRPAVAWMEVLTAALLPEKLREQFGFRWGRRERLVFAQSLPVLRAAHRLSPGRLKHFPAYVDAERFSLAVPSAKPVEGFWPTHDIRLTAPIPNRVAEIFEFLNAPWEEVGGLVLIVEDDRRFRYEYDARLHMRNPPGSQVSKLTAQSND